MCVHMYICMHWGCWVLCVGGWGWMGGWGDGGMGGGMGECGCVNECVLVDG